MLVEAVGWDKIILVIILSLIFTLGHFYKRRNLADAVVNAGIGLALVLFGAWFSMVRGQVLFYEALTQTYFLGFGAFLWGGYAMLLSAAQVLVVYLVAAIFKTQLWRSE